MYLSVCLDDGSVTKLPEDVKLEWEETLLFLKIEGGKAFQLDEDGDWIEIGAGR